MTVLVFTCHSAWQYLAEVHPQLTEKKSTGRVEIFCMSAFGYKQTLKGPRRYVRFTPESGHLGRSRTPTGTESQASADTSIFRSPID